MATRNRGGISLHEFGEMDWIDSILGTLFVLMTLSMTAWVTLTVEPISQELGMTLFAQSGAKITLDLVLGVGLLVVAYATNRVDYDMWSREEAAVVAGVLLIHIAVAFVPIARELVTTNVYVGLLVTVVNAAGFALIAYY
jgi:hypothetical protein